MKSLAVRTQTFKGLLARLGSIVFIAALFTLSPFQAAMAQVAPTMGTTQSVAVLGASTVTSTGPTVLTGDLDLYSGTSITGFPPGTVNGITHTTDAVAQQAQIDNVAAYGQLSSQAPCLPANTFLPTDDLGGKTLVAGKYCFTSSAQLTGTLTLDGQNNPSAVWVFIIESTLTTAAGAPPPELPGSVVKLINDAQSCNVFWRVKSSATIGTYANFVGNIFALASITINTGATVDGRALAQTGAVTLDSNTVTASVCAANPTVGKAFNLATIPAGGTSLLTITLSNTNSTPATLQAALTDILPTLPPGLTVVPLSAGTTCLGGTGASSTSSSLTLGAGAMIPAAGSSAGSCTVTVQVTSAVGGTFINCLATGALQTNIGSNQNPTPGACATLVVTPPVGVVPPTISKAFSPDTFPTSAGGNSTLTITLSNTNNTSATQSGSLIDTLPTGMTVSTATPNAGCGPGLATFANGTLSTVTLTGAVIPANSSCIVTVQVTATVTGTNCLAGGALLTDKGSNLAAACATLTVPAPNAVTVSKAFNLPTVDVNVPSTLTITLVNTNASNAPAPTPLIDTLPPGLVAVGINTASTTCFAGTATNNASSVTLTLGVVQPGSCTVRVNVTAAAGGTYINQLAGATATLTVNSPIPPPTLNKAFNLATIPEGGISTLTIILSNTSSVAATQSGSLIDTLPTNVVVDGAAATINCGGTSNVAAPLHGSTVTLTGAVIAPHSSCTVTVQVTSAVAGTFTNTLIAGALQTSIGSNAAPATAALTVLPPTPAPVLLLEKRASSTTYTLKGQVITYTYRLTNTGNVPLTGPLGGPFTVTDDKLGTFNCGTVTSLAAGASVTCTKSYTIQASDLVSKLNLPTNVIAKINTGAWLQGVLSTQDTMISGAGPGVPNGIYPAWCIEDHVPTDLHNQPATLYSTIGGSLPADVASQPWNEVNYVLNHKTRRPGETNLQFFKDVQTAIWLLIGDTNTDFPVTANAKQMINAAMAHPTFVPGPGDSVAVIIHSDGVQQHPKRGSIQESIFEEKEHETPSGSIVNHATGSGLFGAVVVRSLQVQVIVNQVAVKAQY